MSSRNHTIVALAVLVGAFLVRLAFILQTGQQPFYYHTVADSGFFHQWAAFKANSSWFDFNPAFREPLYAYFLGSIYELVRESFVVARLIQAALGALTALLIYALARSAFGKAAGAAAGVIFALSTSAIFFAAEIGETTLLVLLLVASAYLLHRARRSAPFLNAAFAGLLLGAAFLTRAASAVALPAWIVWMLAARQRRLGLASVLLVAAFAVPQVLYQGLLVKGGQHSLLPLRTAWHAYLGSGSVGGTIEQQHYDVGIRTSRGEFRALVYPDWIEGQKDALQYARIESGAALSYQASGAHWLRRAREDFAGSPGGYLGNYLTKLGILWGASEPPASVDSRYVARWSPILRNVIFSFVPIAALGLVGVLRRGGALIGPALFLPLYSLAASLLLVTDSDKAVLVPFLAVFGGAVVGDLAERGKELGGRGVASLAAALAIPLVAMLLLPRSPMDEARQVTAIGDIRREEAVFDKAETAYLQAIDLAPERADAYLALSRIYSGAWKPDQALAVLDRAGALAAADPRLVIEKANLLFMLDRPAEAIALALPLDGTYPFEPKLHEVLGISLLALGDARGAVERLKRERENTGGSFVTLAALGEANLKLDNYMEAAAFLEEAMRINPSNTGAAMHLADAYSRTGQHYKACDILARVLTKDPGNTHLRFKFANALYRAERYTDALEQFTELSGFDPRNADVLVNLGGVYAAMDSTALAVEMWERALLVDPGNQLAQENLKEARKPK